MGLPSTKLLAAAKQAAVKVALELTPHERWQRRCLEGSARVEARACTYVRFGTLNVAAGEQQQRSRHLL